MFVFAPLQISGSVLLMINVGLGFTKTLSENPAVVQPFANTSKLY